MLKWRGLKYLGLDVEPDKGGLCQAGLGEVHEQPETGGERGRRGDRLDLGRVAEKRRVWRVSGSRARISRSCSPSPISNRRSASSNTTYSTESSLGEYKGSTGRLGSSWTLLAINPILDTRIFVTSEFGLCLSRLCYPPWILKWGGLKSVGQRLISSIGKTKRIAIVWQTFFSFNIFRFFRRRKQKFRFVKGFQIFKFIFGFNWIFGFFFFVLFLDFLRFLDFLFVFLLVIFGFKKERKKNLLLVKVTEVTTEHPK